MICGRNALSAAGALQSFKQRVANYLQYLLVKNIVMADKSSPERQLTQKYGYDVDGSWSARSYAPAAILGCDWALEYPLPIPPRIHVSLKPHLCCESLQAPSMPLRFSKFMM